MFDHASSPLTASTSPPQPLVLTERSDWSLGEAQKWCWQLARSHYENFSVASRFLPAAMRQHVANLYAYCRVADDLADGPGTPVERLKALACWRRQLDDCYRGRTQHPAFVALATTIEQFQIPKKPLADLLDAFERDQFQSRYESLDELLDYCRSSANPVGRLMLHLGGCHNSDNTAWSDSICTGLQLANFCQDVARDWDAGRVYLPLQACRRAGYTEAMFRRREFNSEFAALATEQVEIAARHLEQGRPLLDEVPAWLRVDLALFLEGGLAILRQIRRQGYDVWRSRPRVGRYEKARLLARCWWRYRVRYSRSDQHG